MELLLNIALYPLCAIAVLYFFPAIRRSLGRHGWVVALLLGIFAQATSSGSRYVAGLNASFLVTRGGWNLTFVAGGVFLWLAQTALLIFVQRTDQRRVAQSLVASLIIVVLFAKARDFLSFVISARP